MLEYGARKKEYKLMAKFRVLYKYSRRVDLGIIEAVDPESAVNVLKMSCEEPLSVLVRETDAPSPVPVAEIPSLALTPAT
jgi:hypothetical protein